MDSASFQFVIFGLAVALISNLRPSRSWRSTVLFLATVIFLVSLENHILAFLPLAGFLMFGYGGLILIERGRSNAFPLILLVAIFAYLWLKKYSFLPDRILLHSPYFILGLSYTFFRVLHLLIESKDSAQRQHIGLGSYLLYTLNFTTFVSGPIQRYDEFAKDQFADESIELGPRVIGLQLERIVRGFFKVNVLAMLWDLVRVDAVWRLSQPLPLPMKFLVAVELIVVYPLFLYANFSGYIDIVIGMARLMRVRLPENFDRPFSASSVIEFWTRWHITLSNWLKTYVYNPLLLALSRRARSLALQPSIAVFCFFVTFFLIGVWHGRTSEFIFFGILDGTGVSVNKLWQLQLTSALGKQRYKKLSNNTVYVAFSRGLNFVWFAFTLFWFWASWSQIGKIFADLTPAQWLCVWLMAWFLATCILAAWEWLRAELLSINTAWAALFGSRYARVVYASAFGFVAFVVTYLLNQPAPGIVYKAF